MKRKPALETDTLFLRKGSPMGDRLISAFVSFARFSLSHDSRPSVIAALEQLDTAVQGFAAETAAALANQSSSDYAKCIDHLDQFRYQLGGVWNSLYMGYPNGLIDRKARSGDILQLSVRIRIATGISRYKLDQMIKQG